MRSDRGRIACESLSQRTYHVFLSNLPGNRLCTTDEPSQNQPGTEIGTIAFPNQETGRNRRQDPDRRK
jgi:hypothetical protein